MHHSVRGGPLGTRQAQQHVKPRFNRPSLGQRTASQRLLPCKATINEVSSETSLELIARASEGLLAHVHGGVQASDVLASLHSVLGSTGLFTHHAAGSVSDAAQHLTGLHEAVSSGPAVPVESMGGLHGAASAAMSVDPAAAISAVMPVMSGTEASVESIAFWAAERLAVVQSIDPEAFETMRSSLASVMDAVKGVLDQQAGDRAQQWTNSLVLGVHHLVTALRVPADTVASAAAGAAAAGASLGVGPAVGLGASANVESMLAAQQAMQDSMKDSAASLEGVLKLLLAMLALVVAGTPRGAPAPAAGQGKRGGAGADRPDELDVPSRYDPQALATYFAKRPLMVVRRNAEVVSKISYYLVLILTDWKLGRLHEMMPQRARDIRLAVEKLGPTYIKIAQAASTRVDLVPEPFLEEFARLQDNVPTFSTVEARTVLEEGLGQPVDTIFEWLSEEPLAAASLGQVYRGKLRDEYGGGEVAVKVQRPGVLESAALDIFVMRRACVLFSKLPGMSGQWGRVLDDWAHRFFQEMDYKLEAYNTMTFKQQMCSLQGVRVATVYPELTSRKVIVTEWIEGERLGESRSEDVRALCNTILNCYLIQLLETGLLHADPHPGNLLRTADGKIVILDFGLMTEVTEDQRIALVEFIAHLTMEDWEGVARDLVSLGFMPAGMPDTVAEQIAPVMKMVMGKLVEGGGLRGGINILGLTTQLEGVARNYQLAVPPYFALVLRAFAVIEGVALKADPNYAIVRECLPYLSRRLLTDNNPRMRTALRQLLYGDSARLDIERLQRLISAFTAFTTAPAASHAAATGPTFSSAASYQKGMSSESMAAARNNLPAGSAEANAAMAAAAASASAAAGRGTSKYNGAVLGPGGVFDDGPIITEPMKEALRVVFSKDGTYAQELIVEELVAATDAMSREALSEALRLVLGSAATVSALRSIEALGPLRAMLLPLPLPMEMLHSMEPVVALSQEDRQALNTVRAFIDLVGGPSKGGLPSLLPSVPDAAANSVRLARTAGEVLPLLPELLPGVQATVEMFFRQLIRRMALRLAEDLGEPGRGASPAAPSSSATARPSAATAAAPAAAQAGPSSTYGGGQSISGIYRPAAAAAAAQLQAQFGMMGKQPGQKRY